MYGSKIIRATTLAVLALGASGVIHAAAAKTGDSSEIPALLGARTSLSQALATAEKQTGGRAVRADFEKEKGAFVYEIRTATDKGIGHVLVDPATGKALRSDGRGFFERLTERFDDEDGESSAKSTPTTLEEAVATAQAHTGGKAMEAAYDDEDEHERASITVDVVKDNAIQRVLIDGASGKILKVTAADGDDDHNHEHED